MKCVICGNEMVGYGNVANPVKDGRCCDACLIEVVVPVKIKNMLTEDKKVS